MDIKYLENGKTAEFNGNHYVRDDKTGYYLCHNKYGSGHRLHRDVWEFYNGKIPKGFQVHHIDHNKSNNEMGNLRLMRKSEHMKLHGAELTDEQKERRIQNIIEKGVPAAAKWHGSEEGLKWHSENGKRIMENREPRKYICSFCGKEFETRHYYNENENTFCSNNCRAAHRRKIGADNIERVCSFCGKTFTVNKYSRSKCCSGSCARKMYWQSKRV